MLTVTNNAGARLTELLNSASSDQNDAALRIIRRDRRLKIEVGRVRSGDVSFSHQGRVVLLLDRGMSMHLAARTLGVRETQTGPRLTLKADGA